MSRTRDRIAAELAAGHAQGLYSNCALWVGSGDDEASWQLGPAHWFDLASLTKPLVTTTLALIACAESRLSLSDPVDDFGSTVEMALRHTTGHVAYRPWYHDLIPGQCGPHDLWKMIEAERPTATDRPQTVYSDTGFILLGRVLESVWRNRLAAAFAQVAARPLGLAEGLRYGPLPDPLRARAAATGFCGWRNRLLAGEVHDANAAVLGEHAPHAGLFGTAAAVGRLGRAWLRGAHAGLLMAPAGMVADWMRIPPDGRPLGWDRVGPGASQAGKCPSARTVGHLGFTGTSLWLDPERDAVVVLLTNRVAHDTDETRSRFRAWRPALHDLIWQALDKERTEVFSPSVRSYAGGVP